MEKESIIEKTFNMKSLIIKPIGDVHYGSPTSDKEMFESDVEYVKNTKNVITLFMGDELDLANINHGGTSVFTNESPQVALEYIEDILKTIANKSLGQLDSNHDKWVDASTGLKIAKIRARNVGVPFLGFQQTFKITVGDIDYNIVATHGFGTATTKAGRITILQKMMSGYQGADLILFGHTHDLDNISNVTKHIGKNGIEYKPIIGVFTGSYLRYKGSYAEMKGYAPLPIGTPSIVLSGTEKKITIINNYIYK